MNKYINSINYLVKNKVNLLVHEDKNLFQHLINVYDRLRKWNCNEDLCFAGLFYCVYEKNLNINRSELKDIIGKKAESIVFSLSKNNSKDKKIISLSSKLDKSYLHIQDNFLDKKDILDNYFYFRDNVGWKFIGSGTDNNMWRKFIYKLDFKNKIEKKFKEKTESLLKYLNLFDLLKFSRAYASANTYGTVHESHRDYNIDSNGGITVMYYLNHNWNIDYSGETVFYSNDDQEIKYSVIPKPGRIIVFDGTIKHCARDTRRDVNDLRLVLTFKYYINL